MNKEILKEWFEQISGLERLKITEAQELYKKAISVSDDSLRKLYMDKVVLGTLYVVYDYVTRNDLSILCSSSYDMGDIINSFNEIWIQKIYNGELLTVDRFSFLFTSTYFSDVCNNLIGSEARLLEQFYFTEEMFAKLFASYVELRSNGLTFTYEDLLEKHYGEFRSCYLYDAPRMMEWFEKIYDRLNLDEKGDIQIGKTKIKNYLKLFVNMGIFDNLTDDFQNPCDMETSIINGILLQSFIKDVDLALPKDRDRDIIHQRFGLDGESSKTLEEVAKKYNITRERARQIEAKALRTLRHPSRKLKKYC